MPVYQRKTLALAAAGTVAAALIILASALLLPGPGAVHSEEQKAPDSPREVIRLTGGIDLSKGGYALILGDLVTGRGPLLVEDENSLRRLASDLWYSQPAADGAGSAETAGSAEAPPRVEVATLLHEGRALRLFSCPESDCGSWFIGADSEGARNSGFGALRQRSSLPGSPVGHVTGYYDSYTAYQRAHEAINASPGRWFALPGGEILQGEDQTPVRMEVTLPSELLKSAEAGAEEQTESLMKLSAQWLGESGGSAMLTISPPEPLSVTLLPPLSDSGTEIPLPGLQSRSRRITLRLPEADAAAVAGRIDLSGFPMPDLLILPDAAHQALLAEGYDASCLPHCVSLSSGRINQPAGVEIHPAPGWQIESWRLSEAD